MHPEDKVNHKSLKLLLENFFKITGIEQDNLEDNKGSISSIFQKITEWKK